jgi:hypothetical protein
VKVEVHERTMLTLPSKNKSLYFLNVKVGPKLIVYKVASFSPILTSLKRVNHMVGIWFW